MLNAKKCDNLLVECFYFKLFIILERYTDTEMKETRLFVHCG